MAENKSRAWSTAFVAFWNKSFQTSTGYVFPSSAEHFKSVAKLLGVRCVALEKHSHEIKQRLSVHSKIYLRITMQQGPNLPKGFAAIQKGILPRSMHAR